MATKQGKKSGSNRGVVMTVAVGAISVIMVLTMMLPSLSLIFSGRGAKSSAAASNTTPTTVAEADEKYEASVEALNQQLESDPNSLSALANLGYTYFDWASDVRSVLASQPVTTQASDSSDEATADEGAETTDAEATDTDTESEATDATTAQREADEAHRDELFRRAEGYFDRYLALEESDSIEVSRILCEFYLGETDAALEELETFTASHDFGPAWANLGMFYVNAGENDKAKQAFNAAIAADADDAYGAKSYAEQYLSYLEQIESLTASLGEGTTTTIGEDGSAIITLDGSQVDEDGNVVVSPTDGTVTSSGDGSVAASSQGVGSGTTTSAPTSLKDAVGGMF